MTERKELRSYAPWVIENHEVYAKNEADAVMDKYEERIKGLYDDLHEIATDLGIANERIKELEAQRDKLENKITELEDELDEQEAK